MTNLTTAHEHLLAGDLKKFIEVFPTLEDSNALIADTPQKDTLLMQAIRHGKPEIAFWLREQKVDIKMQNEENQTAIDLARSSNQPLMRVLFGISSEINDLQQALKQINQLIEENITVPSRFYLLRSIVYQQLAALSCLFLETKKEYLYNGLKDITQALSQEKSDIGISLQNKLTKALTQVYAQLKIQVKEIKPTSDEAANSLEIESNKTLLREKLCEKLAKKIEHARFSYLTQEKKDEIVKDSSNILRLAFPKEPSEALKLLEFISLNILIPSLQLLEPGNQQILISKIVEMGLPDGLKKDLLYSFLKEIIRCSAEESNMLMALKICFKHLVIKSYIALDNRIDASIADSINSNNLLLQAPYEHFLFYAKVVCYLGKKQERMTDFLKLIDFSSQNGHILARALYETFMQSRENKVKFIDALVNSLQIEYFKSSLVTKGREIITLDTLNSFLNSDKTPFLVSSILRLEKESFFSVNSFFSIPFLLFSRVGLALSDQLTWHRLMYWFGKKATTQESLAIYEECDRDLSKIKNFFQKLIDVLNNLYRFYFLTEEKFKTDYKELYALMMEKMIEAVSLFNGKELKAFINKFEKIVMPFLGIDKDHIQIILEKKEQIGDYSNSLEAIKSLFMNSFNGNDPDNWDTRSLYDRLFFLYNFVKYPLEEYRSGFISANPKHAAYIRQLDIPSFKNNLVGLEDLPDLGFKILQNNQLFALDCTLNPPNNAKKVFARVGTGLGKSLIIALNALNHAKKGRRVLVVTCYGHLAKRDFKRFQKLFEKHGIKAQWVNNNDEISHDAQIIYAELNTYLNVLKAQIFRKASNTQPLNDKDFDFDIDVLILDEMDSLINDSSEFGNTYLNHKEILNLPPIENIHFDSDNSGNAFRELLSTKPEFKTFFDALEQRDLLSIYTDWFARIRTRSQPGKTSYDSLGKKHSYLGGERYELLQGKWYLPSIYISALAFLTSRFEYVIGFSGTIDEKIVERYQKIYPSAEFFTIPPFYGPSEKMNLSVRRDTLNAGVSEHDWISQIETDIDEALTHRQPVLVFADITNPSQWKEVEKAVKTIAEKHNRPYGIIDSEASVNEKTLNNACELGKITLASHVVGRGADFVLPRSAMKKGLHVLITYPPQKNKQLNEALLQQMIGRTARMNQPGSYSIITNETPSKDEDDSPIEVPETASQYHNLMFNVYKIISKAPQNIEVWRVWFFLNLLISHADSFPLVLRNKGEECAKFVAHELLASPKPPIIDLNSIAPSRCSASLLRPPSPSSIQPTTRGTAVRVGNTCKFRLW